MTDAQIAIFVVTSLVLIITPGQDMMLVMSRSIAQGSKAGVATAAGVSTGLVCHTMLAALGLGALLSASEMLFTVIKLIGAAYLLFLGIRLLRSKGDGIKTSEVTTAPLSGHFLQGAISNLSNPKIAIFYMAYLPQFVPADTIQPVPLLLALGVAFAALTFFVKAPIGYGAGTLSSWLQARPLVQLWINRVSGGVLIALGFRLALERNS